MFQIMMPAAKTMRVSLVVVIILVLGSMISLAIRTSHQNIYKFLVPSSSMSDDLGAVATTSQHSAAESSDPRPPAGAEAIDYESDPLFTINNFKVSETTCNEQRNLYDLHVKSNGASKLLKLNEFGDVQDEPWLLTKSPKLFSAGCWSSTDRYAAYKTEVNGQVNRCNDLLGLTRRTAFVLRITPDHIFTPDALHSIRSIIVELGWHHKADVILLQNVETHANHGADNPAPAEFDDFVIKYTSDEIFQDYPDAKNLENRVMLNYSGWRGRYTQRYFQYVEAWFFEKRPEYEFAYFIDTHVRSLGSWSELFTAIEAALLDQDHPDLLTLAPIMVTKPSAWPREEQALPQNAYKSMMAVHGISSRLAVAIRRHVDGKINAIIDAFLPALAMHYGYNISMFAHPLIKRNNSLLFHPYVVPDGTNFKLLNIMSDSTGMEVPSQPIWQSSESFAETKNNWINGIYQDWKNSKDSCLPGLLIYPVSGE